MKTHMALNGWRIARVPRSRPEYAPWFNLWVKGEKFPRAGGPIEHIAKVLRSWAA